MSMLRGDWERLANCLSQLRPVLIFDHRGMGNSTLSTEGMEVITLEVMARDLLKLLVHLGWMEVAICGYSMGGAVAQQLLHLPFHPTNATPLPFRVTHLFMTATLSQKITAEEDTGFARRFKEMPPPKDGIKRTFEERRELARPTTELTFDPVWIQQHPDRLDWYLDQMALGGRPVKTIREYCP
ncbi:Alpha/Beta hydrolase protein [Coprinopsis sp. MPI-PUGE-AT-0042]|nr:Alpha/Beta hydrolase protein [Coprinopsis sp. MPI-PUGE-AT-0042]